MKTYQLIYIEDDAIDIKNMQWLCDQIGAVEVHIVQHLETLETYLKRYSVDLIITDQFIENIHFSEYIHLFKSVEYMVLSNSDILHEEQLAYQPKQILSKPLYLNVLQKIIHSNKTIDPQEIPQTSYLETISNPKMKQQIIDLLILEFDRAQKQLPRWIKEKNYHEIKHMSHKISGKFSILNMKNTYELARSIDRELNKGVFDRSKATELHKKIELVLSSLLTKYARNESTNN